MSSGGSQPPESQPKNGPDRDLQMVDAHKTSADFVPEHPRRKLTDLVGAETVRRELTAMIERAGVLRAPGPGPWQGGALFYGPPSCGKTFSIEVVAGELGSTLWHIDLDTAWHRRNFGDILERALADKPAHSTIIYINQIDNLHAHDVLAPWLARLDGARELGKIGILGAAVLPWKVHPSIARHGRLGRPVLVLPPDAPLRLTFIEQRLLGQAAANDEDVEWIVERTDGHSFGDLARLVDEVIEVSNGGVIERAAWRVARRDTPPSCAEWLSTAGQHAMMNESGGIYDDLLDYFASRQRYY